MRGRRSSQPPVPSGGNKPDAKHPVNETIRAPKLRVIAADGQNLGILSRQDALRLAVESSLDLVQIGAGGEVPVGKIMDFGKFLYEKKKQDNKTKKTQKVIQVKEIKFRPNIDDQDFKIKVKRAAEFLEEGKRVRFTIQFRGRELSMSDSRGSELFARISADLAVFSLGVLLEEKEQRGRLFWSKVYYLKGK